MQADSHFITRKRKKWKFAHFAEWQNCFEASQISPSQWTSPIALEVGAGTADLTVKHASARPYDTFVAVDVKADRLYTGAKVALRENLHNIAFIRAHLDQLPLLFPQSSISELWITFPDPFLRSKQAKHRLTHPKFLELYQKFLMRDACIYLKTDNRELFLWSLEQIMRTGWVIHEQSFDLHQSNLAEDYKVTTHFERKFIAEGRAIYFVSFARQ